MAEDPIKLFTSRSERFPQSDDAQTLREAIEKGIEQVPVEKRSSRQRLSVTRSGLIVSSL
jgi:hypothetical protein